MAGRQRLLNNEDRRQWVMNDYGLYQWYRASRQSLTAFIRENREAIDRAILEALNRQPR